MLTKTEQYVVELLMWKVRRLKIESTTLTPKQVTARTNFLLEQVRCILQREQTDGVYDFNDEREHNNEN